MSSTIAAFDFDHTLTRRDSFFYFLVFKEGWFKALFKMIPLLPIFASFLVGYATRQEVKEHLITRFLKSLNEKDLKQLGTLFAEQTLDTIIRPVALERLRWHQAQGHQCVLVSAALDIYLLPWAQRHGVKDVIASELAYNHNGQVTGQLKDLNCWGPEKKRRLLNLYGDKDNYILYAYGDSRGDQEILELADKPFYRTFKDQQ